MALDYYLNRRGPTGNAPSAAEASAQAVPVNVYETRDDVVIVAPMPGVEAEDIDIAVDGSTVTLRASLRGPGQADRQYLVHEWTYGPYERTIDIPIEVDAQAANASHSNGVLVVSLPKAARAKPVRIPLKSTGSSGGVREGHSGHHAADSGADTAARD
jgi:HSP20 family protein